MTYFALFGTLLTIAGTVFIVELTDKDALLLLTLATTISARMVFAAGSIAFTISSAIIVLVGSTLILYVPVSWIRLAGGLVMLAYAIWVYVRGPASESNARAREERLADGAADRPLYSFLLILSSLIVLDLAGDGTELVTIVLVAQFRNLLIVFAGAVVGLIAASGVEAALGNRLGRVLSAKAARLVSTVILLIIGTTVIVTTAL